MNNILRRIKYESVLMTILVIIMAFGIVSFVSLESKEASLNIEVERVEKEIAKLQTEIDGLDMKKQQLVSFDRIGELAEAKGYTYKHDATTALAIGVNAE